MNNYDLNILRYDSRASKDDPAHDFKKVSEGSSDVLVEIIKVKDSDFFSRENKTYLALGIGSGVAELALAEELSIDFSSITAVDMKTDINNDQINVVNEDMVDFLRKAIDVGQKYDLVSGLGLDYIFSNPLALKVFALAAREIMNSRSYFLLSALTEEQENHVLQSGFERIGVGVYRLL